MSPARPRLLVLAGPTCAGKTDVAIRVCERIGAEIVSADSAQVYRGLDVGSAKPSAAERGQAPHFCLDLFEPTEQGDVARWCAAADDAIAEISARGRTVVVCGGTGLYLRALLHGLVAVPSVDETVRRELDERMAALGPEALHAELAKLDPDAAERISAADRQRVGRALSVVVATGQTLTTWQQAHGFSEQRYAADIHLLWPAREVLYAQINGRAAAMVESGLIDEVRALLGKGVPADAPALRTLGYRNVVHFLETGQTDRGALVAAIAQGHRRYAKRQLTWFRRLLRDERAARHFDDGDGAVEAMSVRALSLRPA